jgi:L-ascorbate metabolism protein UlaG (beta-lactamase superfamily)
MQITWQGKFGLTIKTGAVTVAIDPESPVKAEVVALTNPSSTETAVRKNLPEGALLLETPGEFSAAGINVRGWAWRGKDGEERIIQRWVIEEITLLNLGGLERKLTETELQEITKTTIDVLFLPIGTDVLAMSEAVELLGLLEPRLVIPIGSGNQEEFAKEMGIDPQEKEKKLSLKKVRLPEEDREVKLLEAVKL